MKQSLIILSLTVSTYALAQAGSTGAGAAGSGASPSQGRSGAFLPAQNTPQIAPGQSAPDQAQPGAATPGQTQVPGMAPGTLATNQFLTQQTLNNQAALNNQASLNNQLRNTQGLNLANTPQLQARLAALQNEIRATLPLLSAFNVAVGNQPGGTMTNVPTPQAYVGGSYQTNLPAFDSRPTYSQAQPPRGALSPTGRDVGFRYPTSVATNAGFNVSPSEFRALVVLQNDMERMLPILSAINQGSLSGTATGLGAGGSSVFGGLTNQFGTPANQVAPGSGQVAPGLNQQQQVTPQRNQLTPTGR